MPLGLKRYQQEGDDHFTTFSCHHRKPYLNTPTARDIFLDSLERTRSHYQFEILGYVVMPEHVHLLVSEPPDDLLSKARQALKISVSRRLTERPFWQARYYDFNIFTRDKRVEKLKSDASFSISFQQGNMTNATRKLISRLFASVLSQTRDWRQIDIRYRAR